MFGRETHGRYEYKCVYECVRIKKMARENDIK